MCVVICNFTLRSSSSVSQILQWGECAAFFRSDDERLFAYDEYPEKLRDTTSGPQSPDLEICTLPVANKDQARSFYGFPTFDIHPILLRSVHKLAHMNLLI